MRLFDYLQQQGHGPQARMLLSSGKVYYKSLPTADGLRDVETEHVEVRPHAPRIQIGKAPVLLHQDNYLMVAFKPAHMLPVTLPGRHEISLVASMQRKMGTILPVNMLDERVSGLMVVATAKGVQQDLKDQIANKTATVSYEALISGALPEPEVTVSNALVPNRGDGLSGAGTGPGAVPAITHLKMVEDLGRYSVVSAVPETHQPAQVRIHLAELDVPIVGDPDYAPGRLGRALPRIALNACGLVFTHPHSGKVMRFSVPLPDDLDKAARTMKTGRF